MLDHISLGISNLTRARRFYDAALKPLGYKMVWPIPGYGFGYGAVAGEPKFWIGLPLAKRRKPKASRRQPCRLPGPEPQGGRRLLQGGDQGRRQGQRQAWPPAPTIIPTTTAPSSSTPRVMRSRPSATNPNKHNPEGNYLHVVEDSPVPQRDQEAPLLPRRHRRIAHAARRPLHREGGDLRSHAAP